MAKNMRKTGRMWYVYWTDENGRRREKATSTDKKVAEEIQRKILTDVARTKAGLVDPKAERVRECQRKPIGEHIVDYIATMQAKGRNAQHVQQTEQYCRRIAELGRIRTLAEITPSAVLAAVNDLRKADLAPRTINAHISGMKQFSRFMWRDGRVIHDPLAGLQKVDETVGRRLKRRALSEAELHALIAAAKRGQPFEGSSGPDRAMVYMVAASTGLRRSELRSLSPKSFHLDSKPPMVVCEGAYTKNGVRAEQPIPDALADALRGFLADKPADQPVFGRIARCTGKMVAADLEAAGIPVVNASGEKVDLHALRHTYCTILAKSGIPVKTLQLLARHSTPVLTLNTYSHLTILDTASALDALPDLTSPQAVQPIANVATGTHGAPTIPTLFPLSGTVTRQDVSQSGGRTMVASSTTLSHNPMPSDGLAVSMRIPSEDVASAAGLDLSMTTRRSFCDIDSPTMLQVTTSATPPALLPLSSHDSPTDPDLRVVIDAWPNLPDAIRAGIMAMIRSQPKRKRGGK